MKKYILIILLLLFSASYAHAWTADTCILGPGDGVADGPVSDDLSTNGSNAEDQWKTFRWKAGGSGDAYLFCNRFVTLDSGSTAVDLQVVIYDDNSGEPGNLMVWGYDEDVNIYAGENGNGGGVALRYCFDLDTVVTSRTITAGTYYWLAWRSNVGTVTKFERYGSGALPDWVEKRGDMVSEGGFTSTPPAGSTMTTVYDDEYYGWTVWTASDAETCDADHLNLCLTLVDCEGAGGYWYDAQCNETAPSNPTVTGTSGTWVHNSTSATITGYTFGSKSPAAPLIWDDCEGKTVDSDTAVTGSGWSDLWPRTDGNCTDCNTRYRDIPYRNLSAPHSNSLKYLAGCHYQEADNDPAYVGDEATGAGKYKNVGVTVDSGSAHSYWYVSFYYTLDPLWNTSDLSYNNHKITCGNTGSGMYDNSAVGYTVYCTGGSPAVVTGSDTTKPSLSDAYNNTLQPSGCDTELYANNPIDNWIKIEEVNSSSRDMYVDNLHVINTTALSSIQSYSVGGYYRRCSDINDNSTYRGGVLDSNYRYFDDIYIDDTLARVMLCNSSTYPTTDSYICEPQIPSEWSCSGDPEVCSITVKVNLGALTGDTAYLYVFDSDNNVSSSYEVTLGGDSTPPSSITGVTIRGGSIR